MKIMLTSDLHGNMHMFEEYAKDAQIVVVAGDFMPLSCRGKQGLELQKEWLVEEFVPMLNSLSDVQFIVVPGNHDFLLDKNCSDEDLCNAVVWPRNMHMLIDSSCTVHSLTFYGSPWVPPINWRWAFEADLLQLKEHFSRIPENLDFLVTHSPPFIGADCDVDRSLQTNSEHFGSVSLADQILEKKPKFAICGHIHSGDHVGHLFGSTMVFNVSRLDEFYDISYSPLWLDL